MEITETETEYCFDDQCEHCLECEFISNILEYWDDLFVNEEYEEDTSTVG